MVWVLGPACSFDASAKAAMQALIENGYAHGLLAGNALATHDLEGSLLHTALGQDIYTQESRPNGHYHHIDVINAARAAGSIPAFIEQNGIRDGIMHACVAHGVPYVLAGSIRDDGPLPGVYGDVYAAQNAMRELVQQATTVICVATQLHTIATGNMTPSYCVRGRPGTGRYTCTVWMSPSSSPTNCGTGAAFPACPSWQCTGLFVPRGRRARLAGCGKI